MKIKYNKKERKHIRDVNAMVVTGKQHVPMLLDNECTEYNMKVKITDMGKANAFLTALIDDAKQIEKTKDSIGMEMTMMTRETHRVDLGKGRKVNFL